MLYNLKTTAKKARKKQFVLAPTRDNKASPRVMKDIKSKTKSLAPVQAQTKTSHNLGKV